MKKFKKDACKICGKTGFHHKEELDFHVIDEHVEPNALEMYYGIREDANIRAPDHNRYVGRKVAALTSEKRKRGGFSGTDSRGARTRMTVGGCPLCGGDVQHDVKATQTGERRDASDLMFGDRHTTTKQHGAYCVNCGLAVHDGDRQT